MTLSEQEVCEAIDEMKQNYFNQINENSDALDKAFVNCSIGVLNILKFKLGLD